VIILDNFSKICGIIILFDVQKMLRVQNKQHIFISQSTLRDNFLIFLNIIVSLLPKDILSLSPSKVLYKKFQNNWYFHLLTKIIFFSSFFNISSNQLFI